MPLRVVPLGGLGEVGLNSMLFDDGRCAFLVDAGLMFPDDTMLGVDFVIPDFAVLRQEAPHLAALILTHGHEDHIGAVPFLLKEFDVPVLGTPLTLGLLQRRLAEHGLDGTARLEVLHRSGTRRLCDFEIETFPVCHSIPDAVGLVIRCSEGVFVHTGDFKIDPRPPDGVPTDMGRLAQLGAAGGVTALFSDSTNVEHDGRSLPEAFVEEALAEIFAAAPGRVIVAMFSSNIHRIQGLLRAAARHGRRVALCGRSMVGNVEAALELGYMSLPEPDILVPVEQVEERDPAGTVVLTTGSQGEPLSALTLMALGEHKHVRVREGDTVVLSSKFIPGNERAIANVINHLFLAGADVLYEKISEVHVSGHASREELKAMIAAVKPRWFVPIHGEPRHLVRHRALAREMGVPRAEVVLDGDVLVFAGGEMGRAGRIEAGRLFVDGKGVGDVEGLVLKDRAQLSRDGIVMAVAAVSSATGELLYGPDIVMRGVVAEDGAEPIVEGARDAALAAWQDAGVEARKDTAELKADVRRALRRYFNKRLERKPVVIPVILEM